MESVLDKKKINAIILPEIKKATERLFNIVKHTPLQFNYSLSSKYDAQIYLKREDLQVVRSYKLRGAYNMIAGLSESSLAKGVVCASAGNHAQGFAYSCKMLNTQGTIFMPVITPRQKIRQTEMFGNGNVKIQLVGDNFDDCYKETIHFAEKYGLTLIPPFDHLQIIAGQASVAVEILEDLPEPDFVIIPVGGGGLAAGCGTYFKSENERIKVIGVEPANAPSMSEALKSGHPVRLDHIDTFVDGAAVKEVGQITFDFAKNVLDNVLLVPEGRVCTSILNLYNENAIVAEPAGALSIAALDQIADEIKGKKVVCVVSGGNNDIDRMQEIKERSLLYEKLKHYFLINFAQRPGALKQFVNDVLGPTDDIVRFEYLKKNNKDTGPALVGIELLHPIDYESLVNRLNSCGFVFNELNKDSVLFNHLI